ncbi:MAG: energy transducer TonB [Sphingomonas sp.]|jgi:TonB family protein|uniref:energy transducer TonB n=1 Tax=Sphingomonas sp. TaxID=28214 RepID=UPI003565A4AC
MIIGEGKGVTLAVVAVVFTLFLLLTVVIVMGFEEYGPKLWAVFGGGPSESARAAADRKATSTASRIGPTEPGPPHGSIMDSGTMRLENPVALVRPVPPPDRALAGVKAMPAENPGMWFTNDAYPTDAIRAGAEGRVLARLAIDPSGSPTACTILTSSRSTSLDATTCSILMTHATFTPARDRNGAATVGDYTVPVRWVLPED